MDSYIEANFDGIVGPTHNYSGLSVGNNASSSNANLVSNPKQAALQGLNKMKFLHDLGLVQGIIPPQERPDLMILRQLGFSGSDIQVLNKVAKQNPVLLKSCYSASSMWTANSATVSPSRDSQDGKIHFTTANLNHLFHRSLESQTTKSLLGAIFPDDRYFTHHNSLPSNRHFGDEGAANHMRICNDYGEKSKQVFVYGHDTFSRTVRKSARQTLAASQAIARLHRLDTNQTFFLQQNSQAIKHGAFHNDVIATSNKNVMLFHELAFENTNHFFDKLLKSSGNNFPFYRLEVKSNKLPIKAAIESYLFNSQIISLPDGKMAIVAPSECEENKSIIEYLDNLLEQDNPIKQKYYMDIRQSMQNGGGPACLRLRVVMNRNELAAVNSQCILSDSIYRQLKSWINKHYRDRLGYNDIRDHQLLNESRAALDELTQILGLPSVYSFQKSSKTKDKENETCYSI
jgi:succinylarginine dihydrolase